MSRIFQVEGRKIEALRIFCVGKNYRKHIQELQDGAPDQPVIFMKPVSCIVLPDEKIKPPIHGNCLHHEVELVVLIGQGGRNISESNARSYIAGLSLGIDLTLRDVQSSLKKKGLPWEIAKAFDGAAPVGRFVSKDQFSDINNLRFSLKINGELRQQGNTTDMMFSFDRIIAYVSQFISLKPGDLIFTGTPSGVGPIQINDHFEVFIEDEKLLEFNVK